MLQLEHHPTIQQFMNRDNAALLDIYNAAQCVLQFASGLSKTDLAANIEKQSAILYQVIIVGKATKRLPTNFRNTHSHSDIPWKDIAGMRDILAHQYDRVNLNTLRDVSQNDISLVSLVIRHSYWRSLKP